MRALINGVEGGQITCFKSADGPALNVQIMQDDGTLLDLSTGTPALALEFYTKKDRSDTPVQFVVAISAVSGIDKAGFGSVTLDATTSAGLTKGVNYVFVKATKSGAFYWGNIPAVCAVQ